MTNSLVAYSGFWLSLWPHDSVWVRWKRDKSRTNKRADGGALQASRDGDTSTFCNICGFSRSEILTFSRRPSVFRKWVIFFVLNASAHSQRLSHLKVSSQSSQRCRRWHVWEMIRDGGSKWGFIAKFLSRTRGNTLRVTRREIKQSNGVSNKGYRSHTLGDVGQRREGSRSERRKDFSFCFTVRLLVVSVSLWQHDDNWTTEQQNRVKLQLFTFLLQSDVMWFDSERCWRGIQNMKPK